MLHFFAGKIGVRSYLCSSHCRGSVVHPFAKPAAGSSRLGFLKTEKANPIVKIEFYRLPVHLVLVPGCTGKVRYPVNWFNIHSKYVHKADYRWVLIEYTYNT